METTNKSPEIKYHWISKLKIPILKEQGVPHVIMEDVNKTLTKKQREVFEGMFGVQTCLLRNDGRTGLYLWDTEAVLVRMFEGKLIGSQLDWD